MRGKRETDHGRGDASVKSGFGCSEGSRSAEAVDFYANSAAETNGSSHPNKKNFGEVTRPEWHIFQNAEADKRLPALPRFGAKSGNRSLREISIKWRRQWKGFWRGTVWGRVTKTRHTVRKLIIALTELFWQGFDVFNPKLSKCGWHHFFL